MANSYEQTLLENMLECERHKKACETNLFKATADLQFERSKTTKSTSRIMESSVPADTTFRPQSATPSSKAKEGLARLAYMDNKHAPLIQNIDTGLGSKTPTSSTRIATQITRSTTTTTASTTTSAKCPTFSPSILSVIEANLGDEFRMADDDDKITKLKDHFRTWNTLVTDCEQTNKDNQNLTTKLKTCSEKKIFRLPEVCQQHLEECKRSPTKYRRRIRLDRTFQKLVGFRADEPIPPEEAECKACTSELNALKRRMHQKLSELTSCETRLNSTLVSKEACDLEKNDNARVYDSEKKLFQSRSQKYERRIVDLEDTNHKERLIKEKLLKKNTQLTRDLGECHDEVFKGKNEINLSEAARGKMQLDLDRLGRVEEHNTDLATANAVLLETDEHRGIKDEYLGDPTLMAESMTDNPWITAIFICKIVAIVALIISVIVLSVYLCLYCSRFGRLNGEEPNNVELSHFHRPLDEETPAEAANQPEADTSTTNGNQLEAIPEEPDEPVEELEDVHDEHDDLEDPVVMNELLELEEAEDLDDYNEPILDDEAHQLEVVAVVHPQNHVPPPPNVPLPPVPLAEAEDPDGEEQDGNSLYVHPGNDYEDVAHVGEAIPIENGDHVSMASEEI